MKCPECGATEGVVYFLRHQAVSENDPSDIANCITILCQNCGKNESYLLDDLLDEIFVNWSEVNNLIDRTNKLAENINNTASMNSMFESLTDQPIEAENVTVENIEVPILEESVQETESE